ncbi:MAG: oxygen-dependent coproporphyrinogen oxidase [Pseudomonadota bacterium]|jgi:coproporphyrinogen III oxidase|nr:MAG: oxygen-dependent coproporphyrinogen oxidase [Pseudomonadota bacterium]
MQQDDQRASDVLVYLKTLQDDLCRAFGDELGGSFLRDAWARPAGGGLQGGGVTAVQEGGEVMERAGVALSDVRGSQLPPAATARNPQLAGRPFHAMGVSVVMHPRNPHVPTAHMNVRYFSAGDVWWFGGGFDLTPYIPYEEDVIGWHRAARAACDAVSPALYPVFRRQCDEYFFLKHRGEARGVGGIFYDDVNEHSPETPLSFEQGFALMKSVGHGYLTAYREVIDRRRGTPWTERERAYQLYRRGRYVEFNLVFDRGTLFGLQSGGRTEAILVSMPPMVSWSFRCPEPELDARLQPYLTELRGRDWLA